MSLFFRPLFTVAGLSILLVACPFGAKKSEIKKTEAPLQSIMEFNEAKLSLDIAIDAKAKRASYAGPVVLSLVKLTSVDEGGVVGSEVTKLTTSLNCDLDLTIASKSGDGAEVTRELYKAISADILKGSDSSKKLRVGSSILKVVDGKIIPVESFKVEDLTGDLHLTSVVEKNGNTFAFINAKGFGFLAALPPAKISLLTKPYVVELKVIRAIAEGESGKFCFGIEKETIHLVPFEKKQ